MRQRTKIQNKIENRNRSKLKSYLVKLEAKAGRCPRCHNKAAIIWAKSKQTNSIPMCDNCYDVERMLNAEEISNYEIFFLSDISCIENKQYKIENHKNSDYQNIILFINKCLDSSKYPDELSFLTTFNLDTLFALLQLVVKSYKKKPKKKKRIYGVPSDITQNRIDRIKGSLSYYKKHKLSKLPLRLPWRLVPPGYYSDAQLKSHFNRLYSDKNAEKFDWDRLEKIHSLKPDSTYLGFEELEGYILFFFNDKNISILDCPIVGNAIFIIKGDWEKLSRLNKSELIDSHSDKVSRIIHRGDWLEKVIKIVSS